MKLSDLAALLGSRLPATNEDIEITGISTLDEAGAGDITFVTEQKYLTRLAATKASAVILPEKFAPVDMPYIPLENVWTGVLAALKHFYPGFARKSYNAIHPTAVIDATARLAENVTVAPLAVIGAETRIAAGTYIGPGVVIGAHCQIGENCTIYANAVLEAETRLGNGVYIQPGAVLGSDGFKYELINGRWTKIPQVGHVEIAADAEVGANTCIDRASYTVTTVGPNTKIDNLVQIAHNVRIGNNSVIVSQVGIAGSTTIGDNTIMAGQSGALDNLNIGNNVVVYAKTGVTDNVPDGETRLGMPARPFSDAARIMAATKRLPKMVAELNRLTKKVAELEARLEDKKD